MVRLNFGTVRKSGNLFRPFQNSQRNQIESGDVRLSPNWASPSSLNAEPVQRPRRPGMPPRGTPPRRNAHPGLAGG